MNDKAQLIIDAKEAINRLNQVRQEEKDATNILQNFLTYIEEESTAPKQGLISRMFGKKPEPKTGPVQTIVTEQVSTVASTPAKSQTAVRGIPDIPVARSHTLSTISSAYRPDLLKAKAVSAFTHGNEVAQKRVLRDIEIVNWYLDNMMQSEIHKSMDIGVGTVVTCFKEFFPTLPERYSPAYDKEATGVTRKPPVGSTATVKPVAPVFDATTPPRVGTDFAKFHSTVDCKKYYMSNTKKGGGPTATARRFEDFVFRILDTGDFYGTINDTGISAYTGTEYLRIGFPGSTKLKSGLFPDGLSNVVLWDRDQRANAPKADSGARVGSPQAKSGVKAAPKAKAKGSTATSPKKKYSAINTAVLRNMERKLDHLGGGAYTLVKDAHARYCDVATMTLDQGLTARQISKKVGVSEDRVRTIQGKILL